MLHRNESATEQPQLNLCFPHNITASQTASEQASFSQTRNFTQTLSERQDSLHTESNTITAYELSELSSHPAEPEPFYCEIANEDATRTAPITEENPVQLPIRVKSHRLR